MKNSLTRLGGHTDSGEEFLTELFLEVLSVTVETSAPAQTFTLKTPLLEHGIQQRRCPD